MRILVVDDEPSLLITLAANLELEGFEVMGASSGADALACVKTESFDLVLSDVRMPGMNGVDLFRRIREIDANVPVLLMTAFAIESLIEDAILEGVFAILPKPFDIDHVIAALLTAGRRPGVLLVDHDAKADVTAGEISSMGIACRASTGKAHVLAEVRERRVDVCVIDVATAAEEDAAFIAKVLEADGSVAVIAVASDTVASLLRNAASVGAFACLRKPFRAIELVHLVAKARARPNLRNAAWNCPDLVDSGLV